MFPRKTAPILAALALGTRLFADEGTDFFEKKVRPLLSARCYECHSADKKVKGGLRLDTRQGWAKGGDTGPAIVPGNLEKSLLITAVHYQDTDLQMPKKRKLPDEEIAILEQWVKMGAPDPRTGDEVAATKKQVGLSIEEGKKIWCYKPVAKVIPPVVKDTAWPHSDIDRFILAKLEAAGLQPAPDATPEVLIRRLYYNLIGLPPTPGEIADFVRECGGKDSPTNRQADQEKGAAPAVSPSDSLKVSLSSPAARQAVEHVVDRLLASPRFGEAWGQHWLDVARFAESSGGGRTLLFKDAWRYRDYVIEAFNNDVPFDRFIREQLAGDLLPAATPADGRRQITATAFLALGATNYEEQDKQQLRFDVIDEQLETMGRALLGQTIGCARCHDHKFDPIPQRDYYGLAGILSSSRTLQSYTDNVARWISTPLPGDASEEAALRAHETAVADLEKKLASAKSTLAALSKGLSVATDRPGRSIPASDLPGIVLDDTAAKVVGEWKHSRAVGSFIGEGYLSDDNKEKGARTVTFTPPIPQAGRYDVRLAYSYFPDRANNVKVTVFHADGEDTVYVDETQEPTIDGRFVSLGKYRFEKDGAGYVLITNEGTTHFVTVDALQLLPENEAAASTAKEDTTNPARTAAARLVKKLDADLKKLEKSGPVRETAMSVRDGDAISDTQIRIRGVQKQRGETVPRGFLHVALNAEPTLPEDESGRRQLADWIASPENPLTARVLVNRTWAWLFGSGIVRTVDIFGTTGEKPSHPELLDYLAARFTREGWSIKRLVRELVLSHTWQQAVAKSPTADPENRLFSHANRRRLDADQIRDTILAVSGQLKLDYLGPNIKGAGEIDANNTSAQNIEYAYVFTDTRRSVYTPAFRNKRLELFEAFDFGDINNSMGQRNSSTVATQALYLLNHPFVLEQAQAAAEGLLTGPGGNDDRIIRAFERTLGRAPSARELDKCRRFLGPEPSLEAWAEFQQTLFDCIDFRYLE
jgi:cytochrome c553